MLLTPEGSSGSSGGSGEIRASANDLNSRLMLSELSQMLKPTYMGNIYQVEHTLTFSAVADDTGTYSCMASNAVKPTGTENFKLFVQGKSRELNSLLK